MHVLRRARVDAGFAEDLICVPFAVIEGANKPMGLKGSFAYRALSDGVSWLRTPEAGICLVWTLPGPWFRFWNCRRAVQVVLAKGTGGTGAEDCLTCSSLVRSFSILRVWLREVASELCRQEVLWAHREERLLTRWCGRRFSWSVQELKAQSRSLYKLLQLVPVVHWVLVAEAFTCILAFAYWGFLLAFRLRAAAVRICTSTCRNYYG